MAAARPTSEDIQTLQQEFTKAKLALLGKPYPKDYKEDNDRLELKELLLYMLAHDLKLNVGKPALAGYPVIDKNDVRCGFTETHFYAAFPAWLYHSTSKVNDGRSFSKPYSFHYQRTQFLESNKHNAIYFNDMRRDLLHLFLSSPSGPNFRNNVEEFLKYWESRFKKSNPLIRFDINPFFRLFEVGMELASKVFQQTPPKQPNHPDFRKKILVPYLKSPEKAQEENKETPFLHELPDFEQVNLLIVPLSELANFIERFHANVFSPEKDKEWGQIKQRILELIHQCFNLAIPTNLPATAGPGAVPPPVAPAAAAALAEEMPLAGQPVTPVAAIVTPAAIATPEATIAEPTTHSMTLRR